MKPDNGLLFLSNLDLTNSLCHQASFADVCDWKRLISMLQVCVYHTDAWEIIIPLMFPEGGIVFLTLQHENIYLYLKVSSQLSLSSLKQQLT